MRLRAELVCGKRRQARYEARFGLIGRGLLAAAFQDNVGVVRTLNVGRVRSDVRAVDSPPAEANLFNVVFIQVHLTYAASSSRTSSRSDQRIGLTA